MSRSRSTASRRLIASVFDALASPGASVEATVVPRLGAALSAMGQPLVLVLDDLHLLESPAGWDAVAALARHVPEGSQLTLSARGEPALHLGALRAHGLTLEIGQDDLRMTETEAQPAPPCRRRGPVRGPRRRAHPTDRGLVGRPLSRRAVDPGAGDQGRRPGDVLGEQPPRLRLPGVGGAGALLPRRASVPDADRRARADVRAALRRGPRGERLLGDAGVAGPLQPVRGGARRPWGLVPIPPPLPGPPPVAAGPRRARPDVGAPRARGRLVRGEPAARDGHRIRAGGRRRRPGGATGRALHHARLPERPCRNRRTLARLAGGAWRARTQRGGRRARRTGHCDLGSAGRGGASGRGGRTRDVRGHPVRRQPVDRRVAGPPARPALSSRGDEDARRCGARDPNA